MGGDLGASAVAAKAAVLVARDQKARLPVVARDRIGPLVAQHLHLVGLPASSTTHPLAIAMQTGQDQYHNMLSITKLDSTISWLTAMQKPSGFTKPDFDRQAQRQSR